MSTAVSTNGTVASQRIAERLRDDILTGVLQPGERIRQEDIAAQAGSSRLPVREALRILHSQGLVQLKANSGAWVATLDLVECQAVYKMRERLEPLALAESIPHIDSDTLERIDDLQTAIENTTDQDRFLALDREMHLLCYAGNPIADLNRMVERFWNTTQAYRRAFVRMSGPERMWVVNAEATVVRSVTPANVDTVISDGRIVKRGGDLVAFDVERIVANARQSARDVLERSRS
jgi:DNA-binding GntR family transcriptional regulator